MTLQPLLAASWAVQVHVATLVLAVLMGTWQFFLSRKGDAGHFGSLVFIGLVQIFLVPGMAHEMFFPR